MNEAVRKVLMENIWYLGTYSDKPNCVPVGFKDVAEDGTLEVGCVFLETTLKNIAANGQIAVSACNAETLEAYQIKGTATFVTEGPVVEKFKAMAEALFKGAASAKGALLITPEEIIVAAPGPDCKKVL